MFRFVVKICFFTANPGMGKTASIALLALKFANESEEMKGFDFVWALRLKFVKENLSLPGLILAQHDRFKAKKVKAEYISSILNGNTGHKVLLLLDGYDEYKRGTNKDIDEAIEFTVGNCFLLLTSRPGDCYVSRRIKIKMDGIVTIEGFSEENIVKCSTLYLGCEEDSKKMLDQARRTGFNELLKVPIILLMCCVVFKEESSLPNTQTRLYGIVFALIMDRTTLSTFNCKSADLPNITELLSVLGEFSWKALQSGFQQLLLNKVKIYNLISSFSSSLKIALLSVYIYVIT